MATVVDIGGMPFDAKKVVDFITEEVTYDRVYPARDFADYFASFIGNGVYANPSDSFKVLTAGFMSLGIRPGKAWINGWFKHEEDIQYLFVPTAPNSGLRKDLVVLRLNLADRTFQLAIKEGTPHASNPQVPALERYSNEKSGDFYELGLAIVTVRAGVVTVTQDDILDIRYNNNYCGVVHALIEQVDTTNIWDQYYNYWLSQKNDANNWAQKQKDDFTKYSNERKKEMENILKDSYQAIEDLQTAGFEKVAQYFYYTMKANKWINKKYEFTDYPFSMYNIAIEPSEKCTQAQIDAWTEAQLVGNNSENSATAYGTVPTIDIPIILTVVRKFGVRSVILDTQELSGDAYIEMVTPERDYDIENMTDKVSEAREEDLIIHPEGEEI